jgi:hypothetical protein
MAGRLFGKDFPMEKKDSQPSPAGPMNNNDKSKGQKRSSERGTASNHKKSPGKRPSQGGSSR